MKQAFGFVQFLDTGSCYAALHAEQGARLKDRTMREGENIQVKYAAYS